MNDLERLRATESESIYAFMKESQPYINGKVLDYGSGRQPYKEIVEQSGAKYVPFDRAGFPASCVDRDIGDLNEVYDTIICNQVMQYLHDPKHVLDMFCQHLDFSGYLIMTYPTHWPEVEVEDRQRFTKSGMESLLHAAMFTIEKHIERHSYTFEGFKLVFGYGVIASA